MNRSSASRADDIAPKSYLRIVAHYEDCLAQHGDSHLGVDWPNAADAKLRYAVMLDLLRRDSGRPDGPLDLLDFGCGAGHLLDHLRERNVAGVRYHGLDLSQRFVALCRGKFPGVAFSCLDILAPDADLAEYDYVIANGVFTEKRELSFEAMAAHVQAMLCRLWAVTRCGLAFNVMSTHVDWQRDELFHWPLDLMTAFVTRELSRHLTVRMDYGLREYTVYVYREPNVQQPL